MQTVLYQIFLIIAYGGLTQSLFVVLLLTNKSVRKSRANIFLSILLLTLTFSTAHILFAGTVINHLSIKVYSLGDPTFYLIAPLLWFYTCELSGQHITFSGRTLLHFLPFFGIIICSISFKLMASDVFIAFLQNHQHGINILFWITLFLQFSWYQFLVQRRWNAYQDLVRQEVSNTENVSISWVRFFMIIFLVINLLFLFSLVIAVHFESGPWLAMITAVIFSLSVFALGYRGILQKEIFQPGYDNSEPPKEVHHFSETNTQDQAMIDRIRAFMLEHKPYLDPELTLSSLAQELGLTRGQLSQIINGSLGDNFYDFINKYRVEEVKRLMHDPAKQNFNLLGIALDAGFKSKSTFNLIFKRFTGLTPTEYKRNSSK